MKDSTSGKSKGYGFVSFPKKEVCSVTFSSNFFPFFFQSKSNSTCSLLQGSHRQVKVEIQLVFYFYYIQQLWLVNNSC